MSPPIVFMFSGQGSQSYHMMDEVFDAEPGFQHWMHQLDEIAEERLEMSILEMIYDPARKRYDPFDRLLYSHPALFMVQYALGRTLMDQGVKPDLLLGASLGEWVALALAEVLSVEDALALVIEQARIFENLAPGGGMLAILDDPGIFHRRPELSGACEMAGINFDRHFIVSGLIEEIMAADKALAKDGISCQPLPVRHGFHAPPIAACEPAFRHMLAGQSFAEPKIPIMSSTLAAPLIQVNASYLWSVARQPIRFRDSVLALETQQDSLFMDLGPSGTVATFVKYNLKPSTGSRSLSIGTPFGCDMDVLKAIKRLSLSGEAQ